MEQTIYIRWQYEQLQIFIQVIDFLAQEEIMVQESMLVLIFTLLLVRQ